MKRNTYWFAPKVYGRGIVPISWEGRLFIVGIMLATIVLSVYLIGEEDSQNVSSGILILYVLGICCISLFPIFFLKKRMKGSLKRRRGVKDIDRE